MEILLDGNRTRDQILAELDERVRTITSRLGRPPGLAVILAGDNAASEVYVRNKTLAAAKLGIYSETVRPSETVTTADLLSLIHGLNDRAEIDAILVQLPLPAGVDSQQVLLAVAPHKDVDGFHPINVGNLATGRPGPKPCTPAGIIQLLKRYEIPISGKRAVVVGRSDIVGKPTALLLLQENATVTIAHSKTERLGGGLPGSGHSGGGNWATGFSGSANTSGPGATVIDVGINRITSRDEAVRIFGEGSARVRQFDRERQRAGGRRASRGRRECRQEPGRRCRAGWVR